MRDCLAWFLLPPSAFWKCFSQVLGGERTSQWWLTLEENCDPNPRFPSLPSRHKNPLYFSLKFCHCLLPSKNAQGVPNLALKNTFKAVIVLDDVCGSFIAVISKTSINFKQPPTAYSLLCYRVATFWEESDRGSLLRATESKCCKFS